MFIKLLHEIKNYFGLKILVLAVSFAFLGSCSLPSDGSVDKQSAASANIEMQLINYDLQGYSLKISGDLGISGVTLQNRLDFYTDQQCAGVAIGNGLIQDLNKNTGIQIFVNYPSPRNASQPIYYKTNTLTTCNLLGNYVFNITQVPAPTFSSTIPLSPSRDVIKPTLLGSAQGKLILAFYTDAACTSSVGGGLSENFSTTGFLLNLSANQISQIYGQATDVFGTKSTCSLMTQYEHTTAGPTGPAFVRFLPNSPSKSVTNPSLVGTVSNDTVKVRIFDDANCSHMLSEVQATDFTANSGSAFPVEPNTVNKIYAISFNALNQPSACTYISTFVHDDVAPVATVTLTAADPVSPTRLTVFPKFTGIVGGTDVNSLRFYSDMLCLNQAGLGPRTDFEIGSGIIVNVASNATTQVYVRAFDEAGNGSTCQMFTSYRNNTIAPSLPIFDGTNPISPNNITNLPLIFGQAAERTRNLYFYSDEFCTATIGSGTAALFNASGIQLTTLNVPNSINTTSVSVVVDDEEGNRSECAPLATYAYSTKPASAATFSQSIPTSPSRLVYRPWILGSAPNSVVNVKLYTDNLCSVLVGQASRSVFASQGIQVNLDQNKSSNLYAVSTDIYGNTSPCTFFTTYIHDNIATDNPVFGSTVPASPNRTSVTPSVIGSVQINLGGKPLPITAVSIYDNMLCLGPIGATDPASFMTTGVPIVVNPNMVTTLYGQSSDAAGNLSSCVSMPSYTHSNRAPGRPNFISSLPASPSYRSRTTISGSLGSSTNILPAVSIAFFNDASCATPVVTAPISQYTGSGVQVLAASNTTTPFYAQTSDVVGNISACTLQLNFLHSNVGPINLTATQNQNGSVTIDWAPDQVASPAAKYTVKRSLKAGGPYSVLVWENSGTSFVDFNVSNGVTYYYVVSAVNNTGYSQDSLEVAINVVSPIAVTPLSLVGQVGDQVIDISWTGAPQNMFYDILRSTQPGGPYTPIKLQLSGGSFSDVNVVNGSTYYYVVRGVNAYSRSMYSNEVGLTPTATPAAPTDLKVNMLLSDSQCSGNPSVRLTWVAPAYYKSFNIKRGVSAGAAFQIANTTSTTWVDCNPTIISPFEYYYKVTAVWGPGSTSSESVESNIGYALIQAGPAVSVYPGHNEINLSWTAVNTATTYDVWRSTKPGWKNENYQLVASGISSFSYHDSSVVNGQSYYYVVVPYKGLLMGWPSVESSGVPSTNPIQPTNLVLSMNTAGVGLDWTPPTHYNFFNIYNSSTSGGPYTFAGRSLTPTYIDNPSVTGRIFYVVTSQWGSFESSYSNEVSTYFGTPMTVTLTPKSNSLDLSWSAVNGATSYQVKRSATKGGPYTVITSTPSLALSNTASNPASYPITVGNGYFYVIQAVFSGGIGQNSNEVSGATTGSTVVSGLSVVATTGSSVDLTWVPITGTASYTVYRSTSAGGPYTSIGTSASKNYTASGLTANTTYYFKVASTTCNTTCQSTSVSAITNSTPSAPNVAPGDNLVDITWVGVVGATSYDLFRSVDNVNFSLLQSGVTGGAYSDGSALNGNQYFYKIRASFPSGQLFSNASQGCTPGIMPKVPQAVSVFDNSNGTDIGIQWAAISGVSRYVIYYSTTSGGPWTLSSSTSSTSGNYILGLTSGVDYYVVISSANGSVESAKSAEIKVRPTVAPVAPTLNATSNSITVSFSAVAGASTYDILRSKNGGIDFSLIAAGISATSYTDLTVNGTESYVYQYRVYSNTGSHMGTSLKSFETSLIPLLGPSQAWAEVSSSSFVKISWSQSSSLNVASYRVYRGTSSGGPYSAIATGLPNTTRSYVDASGVAGQTYYYVVAATDAFNLLSPYSNEVGVRLIAGPASLNATASNSKIQLAWSSVGGASNYRVLKSLQSGGPYGLLGSTGSSTFNFDDTAVENGETYYYIVQAVFSGNISISSSEASAAGQRKVNLQIPVEMVDQALSSDNMTITFDRTLTSIEPSAYDGTVTYQLEVVAANGSGSPESINVVDESNSVIGSVLVPANTNEWTRLKTSINLLPSTQNYRLQLPGTAVAGSLQVYAGRILINQVNGSYTKIYYPLLGSTNTPLSGDIFAPLYATAATEYQIVPQSSIYKRDITKLSRLIDINAWEFETVVASHGGVGSASLYNVTTSSEVVGAAVHFSNNTVALVRSPFTEGTQQFSSTEQGHNYRVAVKCVDNCDLGPVAVYRAGLWVRLTDISKAEIVYRNVFGSQNLGADTLLTSGRNSIDFSQFSNPQVYFRATGQTASPMSDMTQVQLMSVGAAISGIAGASPIASSTLSFTSMNVTRIETSTALSVSSNDNFITRANVMNGQFTLIDSQIVIRISP